MPLNAALPRNAARAAGLASRLAVGGRNRSKDGVKRRDWVLGVR